jgi:hypothetical protein
MWYPIDGNDLPRTPADGGNNVIGCNSSDLIKDLPGFEEMTVSNYASLMKALDACRDAVNSASATDLRPTVIAVSLPAPPPKDKPHHWLFHLHHQ